MKNLAIAHFQADIYRNWEVIVNDEYIRLWKAVVVACFEYYPGIHAEL
jgi:hypothetical protein